MDCEKNFLCIFVKTGQILIIMRNQGRTFLAVGLWTCTIFTFVNVFAQQKISGADSLANLVGPGNTLSEERKYEIYLELTTLYMNDTSQLGARYGQEALKAAQALDDRQKIAASLKKLGNYYYLHSDYINALEYYDKSLKKNIEINNADEIAASYNNLGVIYSRLGHYARALQNHLEQLKINEQTGNLKGIAISYRHIGNVYNFLSEYDKAVGFYQKSIDISFQLKDTSMIALGLTNLGELNMSQKNYDVAIENFNQAIGLKYKTRDDRNIIPLLNNQGVALLNKKEYAKASEIFEESLKKSRETNNKQGIIASLLNLGDLLLKQKRFDESLVLFEEALQISTEIKSLKYTQIAYKYLQQWNEKTGNFEKSLEYYKKETEIGDSLLNTEKSLQIRNLQIVYEVEKKEKEILSQKVSIEKLKSNQLYLFFTIVVVGAIAFVVYYRYRLKKKANSELEMKITEALKRQKEQQQIIVHQASLTSLGELASGIAHEIKQPLQNISLATESLGDEISMEVPDKNYINEAVKDIFEGIKRIKFIINEISNFSRGQQEQLCEFFSVNTRIQNAFSLARTKFSNRRIDVVFDLDENIPDIEGNPYKFEQVIVNFFNNSKDALEEKAEKSGEDFEKKMFVISRFHENQILIEVKDNGTGIPENIKTNIFLPFFTTKSIGKGSGLGLSISLGIIKELGGLIELESTEMEGTTMRIKIPVKSI